MRTRVPEGRQRQDNQREQGGKSERCRETDGEGGKRKPGRGQQRMEREAPFPGCPALPLSGTGQGTDHHPQPEDWAQVPELPFPAG